MWFPRGDGSVNVES